jgi:hypothetical protein
MLNCRTCIVALALALSAGTTGFAANTLNWQTNGVSADVKGGRLIPVLEKVASATGWQVYVEPDTTNQTISAKFAKLAPGEALRLLLGDLNFALVPQTNTSPKLFVFRTSQRNATHRVASLKLTEAEGQAKLLPNELIVRLKPGAKIDELAKQLGAKVIGRIDSLNAYRLQFDDEEAATAARTSLAGNPDVVSVDSNFALDRPPNGVGVTGTGLPPPPHLDINPPADNCQTVVGLIDTALQPLGNNLDPFLLKPISVAGEAQLDPSTPSHGTSMAETMLRSLQAASKGSSGVRILPVDVYGPNASTSTFDVANGIAQAVNAGAKIVNLSLGSDGDSTFLHSVITDASAKNILFVGAAGNTPVTTPFYPAAYPEVNAVTAIDQGQLAPYANRGSFVSLGAPGTSIVYYQNQPYYVEGTSASAAFTSGMAAAYLEANPCATPAKSEAFLRSNFGVSIGTSK